MLCLRCACVVCLCPQVISSHPRRRDEEENREEEGEAEAEGAQTADHPKRTDLKSEIDFLCLCLCLVCCIFRSPLKSSPARGEKRRGKPVPPCPAGHRRRRVVPRAASDGGAWADAPPMSPDAATVPELHHLVIYVIFFIFMYLFKFLLLFNCYL